MIVDDISNIEKYKGINPNLDLAIQYITKTDLTTLPLGKTQIDQDNVYINVMDAVTRPRELLNFEVHEKYMDIQIDLMETEIVDIGYGEKKELVPFEQLKDIGFYCYTNYIPCTIGEGRFIVCMPGEPHRPSVMLTKESTIRKCVIKIAL